MIRCDQCKYWVKYSHKKYDGECRNLPPLNSHDGKGYWPTTKKDDGCFTGKPNNHLLNEMQIETMRNPGV